MYTSSCRASWRYIFSSEDSADPNDIGIFSNLFWFKYNNFSLGLLSNAPSSITLISFAVMYSSWRKMKLRKDSFVSRDMLLELRFNLVRFTSISCGTLVNCLLTRVMVRPAVTVRIVTAKIKMPASFPVNNIMKAVEGVTAPKMRTETRQSNVAYSNIWFHGNT